MDNKCRHTDIILIALIGISSLVGCGGRGSNSPPFELGGFSDSPPGEPSVQIVEPVGRIVVKPRSRFFCRIRITPAEGAGLPRMVMTQFYRGEAPDVIGSLRHEAIDGPSYIFRNNLLSPNSPGVYQLAIQCDYALKPIQVEGGPINTTPPRTFRFTHKGPIVEVIR